MVHLSVMALCIGCVKNEEINIFILSKLTTLNIKMDKQYFSKSIVSPINGLPFLVIEKLNNLPNCGNPSKLNIYHLRTET